MSKAASADLHKTEENAPLVPALLMIARLVHSVMAINLSELGLQPGQDELLLNLEKGRPVSTPQIAARLGVRQDTAAKLISRLVQQRLAMRVESLTDTRSTVVAITASGLEMQARIRSMMTRIDGQLRAGGDTRNMHAEITQLNGRLSRLLTPHL